MFGQELEAMAMDGAAWRRRSDLALVFRAAHHDEVFDRGFDGLRGWWMMSALKRGGWPHSVLRSVAELVVELEL